MLKEALTPLECQVVTASSTALAIFLARKNFPSVVVLHITSPDDEVELPQELANDPELAHIPVLIYIPSGRQELSHLVQAAPARRILPQPDDARKILSDIVPFLRELIDDREAQTSE